MADKSFGIKQLNLIGASGTPTITSPNNLNINASTVAISTDVTIGRHLDVDGHTELDNVNISGVSTFNSTIFGNQLSVSGVSTFAGITTVTGPTLFSKQLNISGVSTFRDIVTLRDSSSTYIINARYDQIAGFQVGAGYWQDRYLILSSNLNYILPSVGIGTTNPTSALTVKGNTSLETLNVSGVSTFTNTINLNAGNLKVATDGIIKVGSSDQLEIYYSGSIGQTIKSTSDLRILTTRLLLNNAANDEQIIEATQNGSVALFHDNSKKFETIGAGVTVTGTTFTNQLVSSGVVTATSFSGSNTLKSRTIVSGATTSIDNNGIGNTNITGFKSYSLMKVGLSTAGWLRLYTDSASRSADASRSIGIDPSPGAGVIAEVVTTGISTTQIITPFVMGGNLDEPVSTTIYAAVTNLSGVTTSISVNLTILQLEV